MIKANQWPKLARSYGEGVDLPGVRSGKVGDGSHRVYEARARLYSTDPGVGHAESLVSGMSEDTKASRERRVARAEACLIALAGAGQCVLPPPKLSSVANGWQTGSTW